MGLRIKAALSGGPGTLTATGEPPLPARPPSPAFAKETQLFIASIPKNCFLCPRPGPPCASEQSCRSDPTGLGGQCSHSLASLSGSSHSWPSTWFSCQAGSPSYSEEPIWLPAPAQGMGFFGITRLQMAWHCGDQEALYKGPHCSPSTCFDLNLNTPWGESH